MISLEEVEAMIPLSTILLNLLHHRLMLLTIDVANDKNTLSPVTDKSLCSFPSE